MNLRTLSSADLTDPTQEVVHRVRQGQPAMVQSLGEDQVVLLDALDYRLLRGVAGWATRSVPAQAASREDEAIRAYFDEEVSLGRAAELLGTSRFDLQARLLRLDIPLRQGPVGEAEVHSELETARRLTGKSR